MIDVRVVQVFVNEGLVSMRVTMRLNAVPWKIVRMLVVRVMSMRVSVVDRFMGMLMFMTFAQMQPKAHGHECSSDAQLHGQRLTEQEHRQECAGKRSDRKIRPGSGCP